jgi:hypothetical protein
MTHSTKISAYPRAYVEIAQAPDSVFPQSQHFPLRKDAERARFQWYYFLRALRANASPYEAAAARLAFGIKSDPNGPGATLTIDVRGVGGLTGILTAIRSAVPHSAPGQNSMLRPTDEEEAMRDFDARIARDMAGFASTSSSDTGMPTMESLIESYVKSGDFKGLTPPEDEANIPRQESPIVPAK